MAAYFSAMLTASPGAPPAAASHRARAARAGSPFSSARAATVLAVEPEPHLRRLAEAAAARAPVHAEVIDGAADRLPAADASCDAAVVSLVLCTVPDPAVALAEIHRVLRPGGQLRFLEHVRADTPARRRVQRLADATVWPLLNGGCHTGRDTAGAIERAGFTVTRLDRLTTADTGIPAPAVPQILGTAQRPADPPPASTR
ncbi:class I SAM-dependent methyltransferase [Spirillospora sp. NPDC048824]|uniref:class I SAM-dependent methyltransferase n=2 Tax=Spirillospora TaxID=58122 RepID=UPI003724034B